MIRRVLDVDLDFFVVPPAHWVASDGERLPEDAYQVRSADDALAYLRERCHLDGRLPGWVIEHHDQAFDAWRDAIERGELAPPFHVTHLDAHADLGLGDAGYVHLLTEVMHHPVEERSAADVVDAGLGFGNWLAYAAACEWLGSLEYVYDQGGGDDLFGLYMIDDRTLQIRGAASRRELDLAIGDADHELTGPVAAPVHLSQTRAEDFRADGPYDAIVLCRSPGYTPESADLVYDAILDEFIETL